MLAASYLLFDVFETRANDMQQAKFDMEIFEGMHKIINVNRNHLIAHVQDLMICVKSNETHVYCNAVNYLILLPYISHWPNLRIHCVPQSEMSNVDNFEEQKMITFRRITENCKRIAIAYMDSYGNTPEKFTKMLIEEWPIVQSYAFDITTQSSREFFTLSREIVNVSREMLQLTTRLDPVFIETMLVRSLLAFTGTLETVYRLVDAYVESKDQSNKVKLLEPLMSTYLHPNMLGGETNRYSSG
ncbi:unnamed protein product [Echinostoma caproni]|uniref:NR LBD domain-containing protein n=1 Tax=Echinostoma caproni TaxID=27848 RepID=A0A183AW24_9TREM|nr:unnamed protein product [Echinostoma caproni]